MTLHENIELFKDAVLASSQQKGISEIFVEKDYWVTVALSTIFKSEFGSLAVFKGGTALSKCYNIIERFSEDIDIVILSSEGESGNQLKTRMKKISDTLSLILPEVEIEGITNKKGQIRKTAHSYNKIFSGNFGQVRDNIILESTWLGSYEPYTTAVVESFITEMMLDKGQAELVEKYNLHGFKVQVLSKERTLCEKIMSLMRFSFSENPIADLNNKIRHVYDIHKMLSVNEINGFFNSDNFEKLLLKVANDDEISFKNNNDWLSKHPSTAIIFSEINNTWNRLKNTYLTTFKELVYGSLPREEEILKTLGDISKRLKSIHWKI